MCAALKFLFIICTFPSQVKEVGKEVCHEGDRARKSDKFVIKIIILFFLPIFKILDVLNKRSVQNIVGGLKHHIYSVR
jgi:hypothetical protein